MEHPALVFASSLQQRAAVENGAAYAWLPIGKPLHNRAEAQEALAPVLNTLRSSLPAGDSCDVALGTLQPGVAGGSTVGLHISVIPSKHAEILDLAAVTTSYHFTPTQLCRWTTLSEYDAEQGKRVQRSMSEMQQRDAFRNLHITADGQTAQTALFVLCGQLSVVRSDASAAIVDNVHITLASSYQRIVPDTASPSDAPSPLATADEVLTLSHDLVEALRAFASPPPGADE